LFLYLTKAISKRI